MRSRLLLVVALTLGGCSVGPVEPPPPAARTYFDALVASELDRAYAATSLAELANSFGAGAALTFPHFEASWTANRLTRYEILSVTRLDRRSIDTPDETGAPFFEMAVRLQISGEGREATITVDGEIGGIVNVDVYGLQLEDVPAATQAIAVDGVETPVRVEDGRAPLLLLSGPHVLEVAGRRLTVRADRLEVTSGPGVVRATRPPTISLTAGSGPADASIRQASFQEASPSPTSGGADRVPPGLTTLRSTDVEVVPPRHESAPGQLFRATWTGLTERARVRLTLASSSGSRLRTIEYGWREAGDGAIVWNGRGAGGGLWAPGTYRWELRFTDAAGNTRTSASRSLQLTHTVCGSVGRIVRYRVFVERGLPTTRNVMAGALASILCEERGWIASGRVRFVYDPEGPLLFGLRSPDATERRCLELIGLSVRRYYSCAGSREVVFNSDRWFGGSDHLAMSVPRYRRLLTFHEVGHTLGQGHRYCSGSGKAPVMMQQSKGTGGCQPNEYPTPSELRSL